MTIQNLVWLNEKEAISGIGADGVGIARDGFHALAYSDFGNGIGIGITLAVCDDVNDAVNHALHYCPKDFIHRVIHSQWIDVV